MLQDVVIEPMTEDFILWRCLHGGPLAGRTIEVWPADGPDWSKRRAVNLPLLRKLIQTYGTCAILAKDGDLVAGSLRFYPKWLFSMVDAGLCLQQDFPAGPSEDLAEMRFVPLDEIEDKALTVHCMMTSSPFQDENPYQRKGLGGRMVRTLIDWARPRGWLAIEAAAYEDLDVLYANTGQAGKRFWQKLGFRLADTAVEPAFEADNDFTRKMREQAAAKGLDPAAIKSRYTMRLDLH